MTNGGGQLQIIMAVDSDGAVSPLANLYHYDPGTEDTANIYSDEALTTPLAQPFVSDSAGRFIFYAKDDFDFLVKDAALAITLDTLDDWHISKGELFSWADAYPAANLLSKGKPFAVIDVNNVLRQFGIQQHTSYKTVAEFNASGEQVFGSVITNGMPVYNVQHEDWGALGDDANDDTEEIQAAITQLQTDGGGILYLPKGTYKITAALTVTDAPIWIRGDGSGQTIIKQTGGIGTNGLTITQSSVATQVILSDFTLRTSVANSSGQAIDINWTAGTTLVPNFILRDVILDPETPADDHWFEGLVLDDVHAANINGLVFQGKNDDRTASVGLEIQTASGNINIDNCSFQNMITGIKFIDTATNTSIDGCSVTNATDGIEYFHQSASGRHFLQNSMIETHTTGVKLTKTVRLSISNNIMFKISASTQSYIGISLADTNDIISIKDNLIEDAASSGTFIGIDLVSGTGVDMDNNQIYCGSSTTPEGIQIAAGITDFNIRGNRIKDATTGIEILAGASDIYIIADNNLEGCTTGLTDGGTGTDKIITDNINAGSAGTETVQAERVTLTTTDATQTALWSKVLDANSVYVIEAHIVGQDSGTTVFVGGHISGVANRVAGNAVINNQVQLSYYETDGISNILFVANGTSMEIQVIGKGGTTVDWVGVVTFTKIS